MHHNEWADYFLDMYLPGMACYKIGVIIWMQESHAVLFNTSVNNIHETWSWYSFNLNSKPLQIQYFVIDSTNK